MKLAAILALFIALGATPAPKARYLDFSCVKLARRQPLPGAPGVTFRIRKLIFGASGRGSVIHRHKFGEILYLLSGSGWNVTSGKKTPLSSESVVVIPANTHHQILPGPKGATLLAVQFSDNAASAFEAKNHVVPDYCKD